MNQVYRKEIEAALDVDQTRLGDVWRLDKERLSDIEIARRLGNQTPGFVGNNRRTVDAMLQEGFKPKTLGMAQRYASRLKRFANRHRSILSLETKKELLRRSKEYGLMYKEEPVVEIPEGISQQIDKLSRQMSKGFSEIDTRLERIEKKLDEHDGCFAALSKKVIKLDGRVDDLQANVSYLDERLERTEKKVTQNNRRLKKFEEIGRRVTAGDHARSG